MSARYCAECGAPLPRIAPSAPGHQTCPVCGATGYRNPVVHAACIVRPDEGAARLYSRRVESGETIQAAALRALGAGAGSRVALYCTLTDLHLGAVFLVFRLREAFQGQLPSTGVTPPWADALCGRFEADAAAGLLPVYTARFDGRDLELLEVPADTGPLSSGPA